MTVLIKETVVDALAEGDLIYQTQMQELIKMEEKLNLLIRQMPDDQRAVIWEYIMLCEDMSLRKLQLACSYMELRGVSGEELVFSEDTELQKKEAMRLAYKIRNMDI